MKTRHSKLFAVAASLASTCALAAVPEAKDVTFEQDPVSQVVTITYRLTDAPAIVTLDIQTNAANGAWVSIGGENISRFTSASDVFRKVSGKDLYTIKWRPDKSWTGHVVAPGGARAVVTAWSPFDPPDYLVADIAEGAKPNSERYYPSVEFIPGGLLKDDSYRTSRLVMRKIEARDVPWTMSSIGEYGRNTNDEVPIQVTLTNDYYIGVFQVTQAQWANVQTGRPKPSEYSHPAYWAMRPVENVSYNEIRVCANTNTKTSGDDQYEWPHDPNPGSFLGILNRRTGLKFDLPSEAQWEFACRAGNGENRWGDGSLILCRSGAYVDANFNRIARCKYNGGNQDGIAYKDCDLDHGSAYCGTYAPNSWGIYDMHGNVYEICHDWYETKDTWNRPADFQLNVDPENPLKTLSGQDGSQRVKKGGGAIYEAYQCRAGHRNKDGSATRYVGNGFRIICPIVAP